MYIIKTYTKNRLQLLNKKLNTNSITIEPSKTKHKKIDIFINGKKTNTIGDNRYMDYPSYIIEKGKEYADKRRELYYKRHSKESDIKDNRLTDSWWARWLLW